MIFIERTSDQLRWRRGLSRDTGLHELHADSDREPSEMDRYESSPTPQTLLLRGLIAARQLRVSRSLHLFSIVPRRSMMRSNDGSFVTIARFPSITKITRPWPEFSSHRPRLGQNITSLFLWLR